MNSSGVLPMVVAAATAGGVDLVEGTDYRVADSGTGVVRFLRLHRDVEVLWERKARAAPAEPVTDRHMGGFILGQMISRQHPLRLRRA